jgi:hypothetical protein
MAGMTDYRDYFAQGHNYFAFYHTTGDHRFYVSSIDMTVTDVYKTGPAVAVDVRSQEEDVRGRWAQYPGLGTGVGHLMFCTAPKWGWNTYQSLVADHVWCSPFTTFWTHPNGSYAFWDNSWVFNAQGFVRDLDVFDVAKLEHVVFDRLKLMITTNSGRALGSTTFRDLYNQAVTAGLDAGTLASDITLITYDQLRATFEKQVFLNSTGTPPTTLLLDLKATWDSHIYFYPEPGICSPHSPIPNTPVVHGLLGLNFGMDWRTGGGYTATINPVSANKHVRFANPLLIE